MRKSVAGSLVLLLCLAAWGQNTTPTGQGSDSRDEAPASMTDATKNLDPLINSVDPLTYRLVPGDQVRVDVIGTVRDSQRIVLDQMGGLSLYPVGRINVGGLTLAAAEKKITSALSLYLKRFQVNLSLVTLRRFTVQISGEVKKPGTYQVTGIAGVAELIERAGGFTPIASKREVEVLENSGQGPRIRVDFARYSNLGDLSQNPRLRPNETVFVPATARRIEISGQVARPGSYELLAGESLNDLLALAGGTSASADLDSVQLGRLGPSGQRDSVRLNLQDPAGGQTTLRDGDKIEIYDKSLNMGRVVAIGELVGLAAPKVREVDDRGFTEFPKQGGIAIREGQTVRELVLGLGGVTSKADMESAWVERTSEAGAKEYIPVNVKDLLYNFSAHPDADLVLENGDTLVVPPRADSVFIVGEVAKRGPVPWTPNYGLREYLGLAGGPTSEASTKHGRLIRRIPGKPPQVFEINLLQVLEDGWQPRVDIRAGDVIFVPHFYPLYDDILKVLTGITPLYYLLSR